MAIFELLELMYYSSKEYFTTAELADVTGLCVTSVSKNLSRLVKRGWIKRHDVVIGGKGRFVTYTLVRGGDLDEFFAVVRN